MWLLSEMLFKVGKLNVQIRSHTKEKPYQCEICQLHRAVLWCVTLRVTPKRNLVCESCQKCFYNAVVWYITSEPTPKRNLISARFVRSVFVGLFVCLFVCFVFFFFLFFHAALTWFGTSKLTPKRKPIDVSFDRNVFDSWVTWMSIPEYLNECEV